LIVFRWEFLQKHFPWIWQNILVYIRNYFFVATQKKIFIRYLGVILAIIAAPSLIRIGISYYQSDNSGSIKIDWGVAGLGWIELVIIALVTISYWIFIFRSGHIGDAENIKDAINDLGRDVKDSRSMLETITVKTASNSIISNLIPQIRKNIDKLYLKQGHDNFEALESELKRAPTIDYELWAYIEYHKGLCSRYTVKANSKQEFNNAFEYMQKANIYNESIVEGKIYACIVDQQKEEAIRLSKDLHDRNSSNYWAWISKVFFAEDPTETFKQLPDNFKNDELFIANLTILGCPLHLTEIINFETYTYTVPDKFTFENLPLWLFYITISFNRYLIYRDIDLWGNRPCNEYENEVQNITSQYIDFEKSTEINNICPIVYALNYFINFVRDRDPKWLEKYKSTTYSDNDKMYHELFYATMLELNEQYIESGQVIDNYGEVELSNTFNVLRIVIFLKTKDSTFLIKAFQSMADHQKEIHDYHLKIFLLVLSENVELIKEYIPHLKFENPVSSIIFKEVEKFYRNETVDVELIKTHEKEIHPNLLSHVSLIYNKYVSYQSALEILRPSINTKKVDANLETYLELLYEKPENKVEEYRLLKEIRTNGFTLYNHFLGREAELSQQCSDFQNANEVLKILFEKNPNNDNVLSNYLFTLAKVNDIETIGLLKDTVMSRTIESRYIFTIFNVYLNANMPEVALDILYKSVKLNNTQPLSELYFTASTISFPISKIINEHYEKVFEGSYVCYRLHEQDFFVDALKDSAFEKLIDCSVGSEVILNINGKDESVQIISIHNKYFKLGKEIAAPIITNHTSKNFKSFTIDELTGGDGILANLEKMSGITPEIKKQKEQLLEDYSKQKATLYNQLQHGTSFSAYYELLFGNFKVYNYPYQRYVQLFHQRNINIADVCFVLDFTSLILIHELTLKFGYNFPFKFVIPNGLKDNISSIIFQEKAGMPSLISQDILNKITIHNDESNHPFLVKMNMLQAWVEQYCDVEIAEEKMYLSSLNERDDSIDIEMECLILSHKENYVLISEDWGFETLMPKFSFLQINTESFYYLSEKESSASEISRYLANLHFIGCNIDADYIYKQYVNRIMNLDNYYNNCLITIERNKLIFREVLDVGYKILTKEFNIDAVDVLSVTNMFTFLLRNMDSQMAKQLIYLSMLGYKKELLTNCLRDAYRIVFPIILD
jgi:hypothetical protein